MADESDAESAVLWDAEPVDSEIAPQAYVSQWRKYLGFVQGPTLVGGRERYLTRRNVDLFFRDFIPSLDIIPSGVDRIRMALQWFANKREYIGENFVVNSPIVQRSINAYANIYLAKYESRNHDAHEGLPTDNLSNAEHAQVLSHLFRNSDERAWIDFATSWTTCRSTFIRQATLRKLKLPHLKADRAHGPLTATGENATILTIILEPGVQKQDSAKAGNNGNANGNGETTRRGVFNYKKQVVGFYRHKNYLQCAAAQIAINLFMRFHDDDRLEFLQPQVAGEKPQWQKKRSFPIGLQVLQVHQLLTLPIPKYWRSVMYHSTR